MAKKKTAKKKQPTFEESLAALEEIVARLEGSQLGLSESLQQYELGVKHLKACYELLSSAERRIEVVSGVDSSGRPGTEPFQSADDESLEEKGAARSKRRTSKTKVSRKRSEVDDHSALF